MARKNTVVYPVAEGQSLATSFHTSPTLVKNLDNCAYQINAGAGATGTFQVQASLDYAIDETNNTVANPGNWIPLTLAGGTPTLVGSADEIIINLNQLPFNAIRLAYISGSGSGSADVYVMCKQIGG